MAVPLATANGVTRPDCCGNKMSTCCCSGGIRLVCCSFCPPIKESKSTKCIYCFFVVIATGLIGAMTMPSIQHHLQRMFRDFSATCRDLNIDHNCLKLTGYMAAFKVSFSFCFLFLFLCIFTLGITSSKGARSYIHNGFWLFKMILVFSVLVAIFVVPISHTDQLHSGWIYVTMLGNWLFMLLQLVSLIDFSQALTRFIHKRGQARRMWRYIETLIAIGVATVWLIMSIVLFLSHGQQEFCLTKQLALISSTGFCISIVLASLTPCARRPGNFSSNLLLSWRDQQSLYSAQLTQSGLVSIYLTFWIWSAMQSAPEAPGIVELTFIVDENDLTCIVTQNIFVEQSLTFTAIVMMLFTVVYVTSSHNEVKTQATGIAHGSLGVSENFVNCIIPDEDRSRACVCYSHSLAQARGQQQHHQQAKAFRVSLPIPPQQNLIVKDETLRTTYSYSLLHLSMALAIMFATTQFTRWFQPDDYKLVHLDRSWRKVGMKVASAWSFGIIYLVYLLLPKRCLGFINRRPRGQGSTLQTRHEAPGRLQTGMPILMRHM